MEEISRKKLVTRIIVEVAGFPKEHIESVIKKLVEKIKSEEEVLRSDIFEIKKINEFWSTFTEIELVFADLDHLSKFCFEYMPSSIEIIEPDRFSLDAKDFEDVYNDVLGKLHHYDMNIKSIKAANLIFQRKLNELGINPESLVKAKNSQQENQKEEKQEIKIEEDKLEELKKGSEEEIFFKILGNKV